VERVLGAARPDVPGGAAGGRLEDLAPVAHDEGAVLREGLNVVELVGHVDRALPERDHLDFVMTPEREHTQGEPERDRPTTHTTPSGDPSCETGPRKRRPITNRTSKCQWDGGDFVASFLGNHFGMSACSSRICESTFHAPSSRTSV